MEAQSQTKAKNKPFAEPKDLATTKKGLRSFQTKKTEETDEGKFTPI